jgi:hypothetical protein
MCLLSGLSCGLRRISQGTPATPPLQTLSESDSRIVADPSQIPRLHLVKTFSSITSRPTEEEFQTPKKSHSFPSTIGRGLNKLSRMPATAEPRIGIGDSLAGKDMAGPYNLLYERIYAEVSERLRDNKPQWLSPMCGKKLLKREEVRAALEEAKRHHTEWKNDVSHLTAFVCDNAPQLSTMLIYAKYGKLLDLFCDKGMGDAMFPVKLVSETCIESTTENPPRCLELGSQIDIPGAMTLVDLWQWIFFVPKLRWTTFNHPPFDSKCRLPLRSPLFKISSTEFSNVYKGLIHKDHVAFDLDGIVST